MSTPTTGRIGRLLGFLDATNPTSSLRHAAYALVVVCACGWLTWDMIRGPINDAWNVAFGLLLSAVTVGKIVGSKDVQTAEAQGQEPDPIRLPMDRK